MARIGVTGLANCSYRAAAAEKALRGNGWVGGGYRSSGGSGRGRRRCQRAICTRRRSIGVTWPQFTPARAGDRYRKVGLKISGSFTLPFPQEQAYAMMQDPEVLARAIPGCESLEKIGRRRIPHEDEDGAWRAFRARFEGKVRITDQLPPSSFRLVVEGSGKIGFVKGEGLLKLTPAGAGTEVAYDGDVQVGGTIAAVGQRLIDGTRRR